MGEKPSIDLNALREQMLKDKAKSAPELTEQQKADLKAAEEEPEGEGDAPKGPSLESLRAAVQKADEGREK